MYTCYLDDSDNRLSSIQTIAGYIASDQAWSEFEEQSKLVYEKYRIGDVLHGVDFRQGKGPFRGWSASLRLQFVDDIFFGQRIDWAVGAAVNKNGFNRHRDKETYGPFGPQSSPIAFAFGGVVTFVTDGNRDFQPRLPGEVSFVVESGHRNNPSIERWFEVCKHMPDIGTRLGSLTFEGKSHARALHLADLLTYFFQRDASLRSPQSSLIIPEAPTWERIKSKTKHHLMVTNVQTAPTFIPLSDEKPPKIGPRRKT